MSNCRVCGTKDKDKPQIFMNEPWCSDNHRKVVLSEREPTHQEWITMDRQLFLDLDDDWQAPDGVKAKRRSIRKGI